VPTAKALEEIVHGIDTRLAQEATPQIRAQLLTAAYVLTGLRTTRDVADQLFKGVLDMKDSTTYQAILEEGAVKGSINALQETLLRQGRHRFGSPGKAVQGAIKGITDLKRLERMTERLLQVSTWQELLNTP
jgi:predicted transposase YdaD